MPNRLTAFVLALLLSGCASTPPVVEPVRCPVSHDWWCWWEIWCEGGWCSWSRDWIDRDVDDEYLTQLRLVCVQPWMSTCMLGPGSRVGTACLAHDYDFDGDVDLKDWAVLQRMRP